MQVKRILFALLFSALVLGVAGSALARDRDRGDKVKLIGQVTTIDVPASTFTIKAANGNFTYVVTPFTEIELEGTDTVFHDDRNIPLSDLKVGDWVKVKAYRDAKDNMTLHADEVDVRRPNTKRFEEMKN